MSGPPSVLSHAVAGTPLATRLLVQGEPLFERRGAELRRLDPSSAAARALARVVASSRDAARYLALRPALLASVLAIDGSSLEARARNLRAAAPEGAAKDLEGFLDGLRLFRRDENLFAACVDLGGFAPFEEISSFLSRVAEIVIDRALNAALRIAHSPDPPDLTVLAFGKLAGKEINYSSDLDLIFLYEGGPDAVFETSCVAQRLIHYLSTPTGAGVAYTVDTRLRPSGGQGMLVTSFDAYERYQLEEARTWEHLALMRGRAVAGVVSRGGPLLGRIQDAVRERRISPWGEVARLRERIRVERTDDSPDSVPFKTGVGGLMDVDFLATGAQLERGTECPRPEYPAVPAHLQAVLQGSVVDGILEDYHLLRLVAARAGWVSGRSVEKLRRSDESLPIMAELVEPDLSAPALLDHLRSARSRVRNAIDSVLEAASITALDPRT